VCVCAPTVNAMAMILDWEEYYEFICGPSPADNEPKIDVHLFEEVVFAQRPGSAGNLARDPASLVGATPQLPDACVVCLADFTPGERLRSLPCNGVHCFHKECLQSWLATNPTCPICRENVQPRPLVCNSILASQADTNQNMERAAGLVSPPMWSLPRVRSAARGGVPGHVSWPRVPERTVGVRGGSRGDVRGRNSLPPAPTVFERAAPGVRGGARGGVHGRNSLPPAQGVSPATRTSASAGIAHNGANARRPRATSLAR